MKWFDITDEAKNQMYKMIEKNPGKYAISLAVKGGGCAGFKYDWFFVYKKEDIGKDDEIVEWDNTRFVVDETSISGESKPLVIFENTAKAASD